MTELTYEQVLQAKQAYLALQGVSAPAKFHYAVRKNLDMLQPVLNEMAKKNAEAATVADEAKPYQDARIALNKEYAEKDEKGEAKTDGPRFIIVPERRAEFDEKIKALQGEHRIVLDKIDAARKEFGEWMQTKAGDYTVHTVHLDYVPDMPPEIYDALSFMFTDEMPSVIQVAPVIGRAARGQNN